MSSTSPDTGGTSVDQRVDSPNQGKTLVQKLGETKLGRNVARVLHRALRAPDAHQSLQAIADTENHGDEVISREDESVPGEQPRIEETRIPLESIKIDLTEEVDSSISAEPDHALQTEETGSDLLTTMPTDSIPHTPNASETADVSTHEKSIDLIPPVNFPNQDGVAYLRFAGVNDLQDLLREQGGIHLPSQAMQESHGTQATFPTTYFHLVGKLSEPGYYINPQEDGSSEMDFHRVDAKIIAEQSTRNGYRYGVAVLIRVTPENFSRFSGKIIEQQEGVNTTDTHKGDRIDAYEKLGAGDMYAVIDTQNLAREDLRTLGDDLQLAIYDSQAPGQIAFKPWNELEAKLA